MQSHILPGDGWGKYQSNREGGVGNKTPCLPLLVELVLSLFETKMPALCCISAIATDTRNTPDGDRNIQYFPIGTLVTSVFLLKQFCDFFFNIDINVYFR